VENTDRWVAGKSRDELMADLRVYLARLRDDPRSIIDRLRVAAIQLRLGRPQEALIHYEGVLRGYVADGQIPSAIALCQRILALYPELPRMQRILAALYARAPRSSGIAMPIAADDRAANSVLTAKQGRLVMQSVFPESRRSPVKGGERGVVEEAEDLRATMPYLEQPDEPVDPTGGDQSRPLLLACDKHVELVSLEPAAVKHDVVLLTRIKRKG
jgi:hypothetical protein